MLYSERQKYNFLIQSLDTPSAVLRALHNLRERKKKSRFALSRACELRLACQHCVSNLIMYYNVHMMIRSPSNGGACSTKPVPPMTEVPFPPAHRIPGKRGLC